MIYELTPSSQTGSLLPVMWSILLSFFLIIKIMTDRINHPDYYNKGKIEVIDFIEDQELGFHLGNAVKYISRAGAKNTESEEEDLKKAIWYLQRKINKE